MNRISETDEFNDSPAIANNENGKKLSFNTLKKMYNTKFAKLKYGNNQELIFNIESKVKIYLSGFIHDFKTSHPYKICLNSLNSFYYLSLKDFKRLRIK